MTSIFQWIRNRKKISVFSWACDFRAICLPLWSSHRTFYLEFLFLRSNYWWSDFEYTRWAARYYVLFTATREFFPFCFFFWFIQLSTFWGYLFSCFIRILISVILKNCKKKEKYATENNIEWLVGIYCYLFDSLQKKIAQKVHCDYAVWPSTLSFLFFFYFFTYLFFSRKS